MVSVHSSESKSRGFFVPLFSRKRWEDIVIQVQWDPRSGWLVVNGCPNSSNFHLLCEPQQSCQMIPCDPWYKSSKLLLKAQQAKGCSSHREMVITWLKKKPNEYPVKFMGKWVFEFQMCVSVVSGSQSCIAVRKHGCIFWSENTLTTKVDTEYLISPLVYSHHWL